MKTPQTSIFALLSIALVFTACQKDSIVDMDILSQKDSGVEQQDFVPGLSKSIPVPVGFEHSQIVEIQRPDCSSSTLEEKATDQISMTNGCYGVYGLTDESGRGWVEEFGSFTSKVSLEYDPSANEINGTVTFIFDRESATLVLKTVGRVEKSSSTSNGKMLMVSLKGAKTSGPFDLLGFVGQLYVMRAELISDPNARDHNLSIKIIGDFGVDVRNPGDYAIEKIHNNRYN